MRKLFWRGILFALNHDVDATVGCIITSTPAANP